jgi:ABC-type proline/glycine betaine transport system permease subunit
MKPKPRESMWKHVTHYASSELSLYAVMIIGIILGIIIFS